jgi:hypothetical protein
VVTSVGNGTAVIQAQAGPAVTTVSVQVAQVAVAPQKIAGDLQSAVAAQALPLPLRVRVVDRLGNPMFAQSVTFAALGGGSVGSTHATSGSDGTASTTWTLGPSIAQNQQVTVSVGDGALTSSFSAMSVAGPPAGIGFANGGQAIVYVGATTPGTAAARDANSNPVAALPLTYVSRNPAVATVNAAGVITGVGRGQVVIVASSAQPALTDSLLAIVGVPGSPIVMSSLTGFSLKADTTRTVSVFVNMGASATGVSSGIVTVSWDPAVMQFTGSAAGAGVASVANTADAAAGNISLAFAGATGETGNVEVLKITFHAGGAPGSTGALTLTSSEMTASDFTDLTPNLVQVLQRVVLR